MNESRTPFDHRQDPIVGAALRRLLTTTDDAGFTARVLAAAARPAVRSPVEILATWARPGIAAAVVAGLVGGFVVGRRLTPQHEALEEAMVTALAPSAATAALATSDGPRDGSVAFATFVEP